MLAKKNRLPISTNTKHFLTFPAVFFSVKVGENKINKTRFNFVVAKSIDKRATVRNRLKRQLRSFTEENYSKIKKGYDFLFKVKKEARGRETKEIHNQIKQVLKKEGLIE